MVMIEKYYDDYDYDYDYGYDYDYDFDDYSVSSIKVIN